MKKIQELLNPYPRQRNLTPDAEHNRLLGKDESNPEVAKSVRITTDVTDKQGQARRRIARPPAAVKTGPSLKEDGFAMSIGGGGVAPIAPADASAVYSLQKDRYKKQIKTNMTRRKKLD